MKQSPDQSSDLTPVQPGPTQGIPLTGADDGEAFARFVQFLKKRAWLVIVALVLGIIGGLVANKVMTKEYTATTQIEIVPDQTEQFRLEQIQALAGGNDAQRLDTESSILQSRTLALDTVRALRLNENNKFYPLINGQKWDMSKADVRALMSSTLIADLNVTRVGHTSIIEIDVTTADPHLSEAIAKTLVNTYIDHSFQDNYLATEKVSGWLNDKLHDLRQALQDSQAKLIALQHDIGMFDVDPKDSIIVANLQEMNKGVADAEVDRLMKEARLHAVEGLSPAVLDASSGVMDPELAAAKQSLQQLRSQYTTMQQSFGPGYPRLKVLKAQIDAQERILQGEENAVVARAKSEFDVAASNEASLRKALDAEKAIAFSQGEKGVEFAIAKQDYEANRLLYDGLQERLQEAKVLSSLHSSTIHIVDEADTPVFPSRPRTTLNFAAGAGGGLVLGIALALLLEGLDTNLKTMSDIEKTLQLPLLAAIPAVETEDLLPAKYREMAVARGSTAWSRIAESLRGMRTSILLSSPGKPPQVIMVTSTRPAEGKSSVATLMAITFALNGSKVLLIDADLRRPSVHLRFRIAKGSGLSTILSGKAQIADSIVEWPDLPNLHIMTSGPVPPLPSELLGSKQMSDVLEHLRGLYDFILIDTPPVLAVTDASVLGRLADAAVLIIRYGTAQRHVVQRCIDLLDRSGTHLLGVAVNVVDYKAPEYSEYYGRKYYEYYGERNPE